LIRSGSIAQYTATNTAENMASATPHAIARSSPVVSSSSSEWYGRIASGMSPIRFAPLAAAGANHQVRDRERARATIMVTITTEDSSRPPPSSVASTAIRSSSFTGSSS
jgi:hypothetical protein